MPEKPCTKKENEELLRRIARGDKAATRRFIEGNMAYVVRKVTYFLRKNKKYEFLRDDLISEGYLTLVQIAASITNSNMVRDNPQGLIFTALKHAFVKMVEKEWPIEPIDEHPTYEDDAVKDLRHDLLICCKDDLDEDIIRLRYAGYSDKEIANRYGISHVHVWRTRQKVYQRLQT